MDPYNQWGDENQVESHEMGERAPINYNQNTYMTNDARETSVESLNIDSMQAKRSDYDGEPRSYYNEVPLDTNFWKYSEQIKSILAGILLLFCGGMHTVWTIYQMVFYDTSKIYREDLKELNVTLLPSVKIMEEIQARIFSNRFVLSLTIVMWYVGIMIGCFASGWFLVRIVQKKNIYYIAALFMFVSGCLFYSADVADSGWQSLILCGRFMAGISHGLTYVAVFVQASENAARDFRRILATIIGLSFGFSMFVSAVFLINIPLPGDQKLFEGTGNVVEHSEMMSTGAISTTTFIFAFFSVVLNFFFSHETVPFLLYHNYREEEAQFALAKLLGEEQNSVIVQQEFTAIRTLCNDDYTEFPEGKIFTTIHRSIMSIPLSARIASAQCINILYIILLAKFIKYLFVGEMDHFINDINKENETILINDLEDISDLVAKYQIIVRSQVSAWFFCGLLFTLLSIYMNWRRGLHFYTFITGATMLIYALFRILHILHDLFKALSMLFLIVYVHFLSLPIDILGYNYLMECFPISTKAKAIAFVTICESLLNSFYATLELRHDDVFIEFIVTGVVFFVLGYKLYCVIPNTNGLSLGAAKLAYLQSVSNLVWWKQWIPKRFYPTPST